MFKQLTQPLQLTNPWGAPTRTRVPGAATNGPELGGAKDVVDHYGAEPLPPELHQRLSSLAPRELARAFSAHVLDKHDRREIFRHRLAAQFPGASRVAQEFGLDEEHDYNKLLEFMETGRWPRGVSDALVRLYPPLLNALLTPLENAYKKQAVDEVAAYLRASGNEPDDAMLAQVEHAAEKVCEGIRAAHLQGQSTLHVHEQPTLLSLPPHLTSLLQLRKLVLSKINLHTWPDFGKLRNLEELSIVKPGAFTAIPDSLREAPRLKVLKFSGLPASRGPLLPQWLASHPTLALLDVGDAHVDRPAWLPEHIQFQKDGAVFDTSTSRSV